MPLAINKIYIQDILPGCFGHATASSLLAIRNRVHVLLLRLPARATKEISDAFLPFRRRPWTDRISTSILILSCDKKCNFYTSYPKFKFLLQARGQILSEFSWLIMNRTGHLCAKQTNQPLYFKLISLWALFTCTQTDIQYKTSVK